MRQKSVGGERYGSRRQAKWKGKKAVMKEEEKMEQEMKQI